MIITKKKPFSEIKDSLAGEKKVFIVGCAECAALCRTGGEDEVKEMKRLLEEKGLRVTGFIVPDAPCVSAQLRREYGKNRNCIDEADSILVLACGLGAQSAKDIYGTDKPVHVGCDTLFMGQVKRAGVFLERCSGCGECVLELTGGFCPVTRCPKGLLNGPCGGQDKGKCEVNREIDCVWVLIYDELKKRKKLASLREITPPKDRSKKIMPQLLIIDEKKLEKGRKL
jgi:hypothetical protein